MNPGLSQLKPYPFERLAALRAGVDTPDELDLINLSIGEPQHDTPACIREALVKHLKGTANYPATRGLPALREAIATWANQRFGLNLAPLAADTHILPVNGTREALFAIAQAVIDCSGGKPLVAMPNPFYQIYEGAALLAGARPIYLPCRAGNEFKPDFGAVSAASWQQVSLVYVCSPGNPAGAVLSAADYDELIALADQHDFVVVADECYSELYHNEDAPPLGLLEWCAQRGRSDYRRCLVMHSLSKRSNAPGLRSGFVAGDAKLINEFFRYRTYQGGAMPLPTQHASIAAWQDETHVVTNRARYRAKFSAVAEILSRRFDVQIPPAGFYLWPQLGENDIKITERLLGEANVLVLPGQFLGREVDGSNPAQGYVRIALVAELEACVEAAERIIQVL